MIGQTDGEDVYVEKRQMFCEKACGCALSADTMHISTCWVLTVRNTKQKCVRVHQRQTSTVVKCNLHEIIHRHGLDENRQDHVE